RVALLVDELAGVQDVVIKSLPAPLLRVRYSAGATVLGTGEVVIVLNVADLARSVENTRLRPDDEVEPGDASSKPAPLVLVADDSITTRTLEKSILETAGYRVHVVADGEAAWQTLGQNEYDLVVSDVSMPRVDGFELTSRIRGDARLKNVPVVLVTSLDSIQDRERGVQVGADAYILKGTFDQGSFLAAVERLTG
ncbi:MAG TPA: response regulator, partial [Anaerolineae bacterium]